MSTISRRNSKKVYLSGWIHLKMSGESDYRRVFAKLQSRELLMFASEESARKNLHVEDCLSLKNICDVVWRPVTSLLRKHNNPTHIIAISVKPRKDVKLKLEEQSELKNWFRLIHAVAMLRLPDDVKDIMPGQVQQLHDVIKEVESFSSAQSRSQTWYKPSPPVGIPLYPPPAYPKTPSENSSFTDEELNKSLEEDPYLVMNPIVPLRGNQSRKISLPNQNTTTPQHQGVTRRISVIPEIKTPRHCPGVVTSSQTPPDVTCHHRDRNPLDSDAIDCNIPSLSTMPRTKTSPAFFRPSDLNFDQSPPALPRRSPSSNPQVVAPSLKPKKDSMTLFDHRNPPLTAEDSGSDFPPPPLLPSPRSENKPNFSGQNRRLPDPPSTLLPSSQNRAEPIVMTSEDFSPDSLPPSLPSSPRCSKAPNSSGKRKPPVSLPGFVPPFHGESEHVANTPVDSTSDSLRPPLPSPPLSDNAPDSPSCRALPTPPSSSLLPGPSQPQRLPISPLVSFPLAALQQIPVPNPTPTDKKAQLQEPRTDSTTKQEDNADVAYKWFVNKQMSRRRAEKILTESAEHGNMLLRRRETVSDQDPWVYAVSVKCEAATFKHYLVRVDYDKGCPNYVIHLGDDIHPRITSLVAVMALFQSKSKGEYQPLKNIVYSHQPSEYDDCLPGMAEENPPSTMNETEYADRFKSK